LVGWDRQRRKALSAVAELRRDVLSMRHAVKERHARLAVENNKAAAQLITREDAVSPSVREAAFQSKELPYQDAAPESGGAPEFAAPIASASVEPPLEMTADASAHSAELQTDKEEAARVIDMADVAKTTLTAAARKADSPERKAELMRIGEAFAKTRGALSDEDRRENTLGSPARSKRARVKKTP
jgi:hypothetical protein